jgi:hypothetical protein
MSTIKRSSFVDSHANKSLSLEKLRQDKAARSSLAKAGSSVEQVAKADLDKDGRIAGRSELEALFKQADVFDHDGCAQSLVDKDSSGKQTKAGSVLAAVEGSFAQTPGSRTGQAIASAALNRIARFGECYGVDGAWKSCNPGIPGNRNPDETCFNAMKGHWKCNLFAMDCLYQAGFLPPTYSKDGKGWYPIAVDLHKYAEGPNRFFDKAGEVKLEGLSAEAREKAVEEILKRAQPGDLLIVNHPGPDESDGGHCRVVTANNYASDGTIDCAQASFDSARVEAEELSSFTGEEAVYLLRPCRTRSNS